MTEKELLELLSKEVITPGEKLLSNEETLFILKELATNKYNPAALDLCDIGINKEAARYLGPAVQACPNLIYLNLMNCDLDDEAFADEIVSLADAIKSHKKLLVVNLCGNMIPLKGIIAIAEVIKNNSTLLSLDLSANRILGYSAGFELYEALENNHTLLSMSLLSTLFSKDLDDDVLKAESEIEKRLSSNRKAFQTKIEEHPNELLKIEIPNSLKSFLKPIDIIGDFECGKNNQDYELQAWTLQYICKKQSEYLHPPQQQAKSMEVHQPFNAVLFMSPNKMNTSKSNNIPTQDKENQPPNTHNAVIKRQY